ncbi:MAG: ABC transporter permease [Anaerolineales bacterium]
MRRLNSILWANYKVRLMATYQYRFQEALGLLSLMFEAVIYLVVWTTVAVSQGGQVGGYTTGELAGYYIGWMFVRNITTGWSPQWFEYRIREGEFNTALLRPVHPYFPDIANMVASKTTGLITLLPTMAILALLFQPQVTFVAWSLLAMVPALILAFFLRFTLMYVWALTAFWTTRITAIFELYYALEFFFSGRIAPLSLLPEWAQTIAFYTPFPWTFGFPLELLLGRLTPNEAAVGFGMQALWLTVSVIGVRVIWRGAVKQYTAVGG